MINTDGGYCQLAHGKIYYERYQTETSKFNIPMFYINGGPGGDCQSKRALTKLKDYFPVIIYDPLGCGHSDPITDDLMTLEYFTNELSQLIQGLGYHYVNIVGHSWGGAVATNFAAWYPNLLNRLILSSPLISTAVWVNDANYLRSKLPNEIIEVLDKHEREGTTNSKAYENASMGFYRRYLCRLNPWPNDLLDSFSNSNNDMYQKMWGASEFYVTGTLKNLDLSWCLSGICAQTLFICGRYDEARPESMEYFASLMPHATVQVLENSAHMGLQEEPQEYISILQGFLEGL